MLGFPLLYFKGMRLMMFQLSGFYCTLAAPVAWRRSGGRTGGPQGIRGRVPKRVPLKGALNRVPLKGILKKGSLKGSLKRVP